MFPDCRGYNCCIIIKGHNYWSNFLQTKFSIQTKGTQKKKDIDISIN